jgi:hypothetical protein
VRHHVYAGQNARRGARPETADHTPPAARHYRPGLSLERARERAEREANAAERLGVGICVNSRAGFRNVFFAKSRARRRRQVQVIQLFRVHGRVVVGEVP